MGPLIKVAATVAAAAVLVLVATTSGPKFGPPPQIDKAMDAAASGRR